MNRRSFLGGLIGMAGMVMDPERALWVPGAKTIFIPAIARPEVRAGDAIFLSTAGELWFSRYDGPRVHLGNVTSLELSSYAR